jgi:hypothetical protein
MGNSPHRRKPCDTVKLFTMAKTNIKPPKRESVTGYLPQDILDQLKELDVGLRALTLQVGAEKIRRQASDRDGQERDQVVKQNIKPSRARHKNKPGSGADKDGRNGKIKLTSRPQSAHLKH